MDPNRRITSEQAMQDPYFTEDPLPTQVYPYYYYNTSLYILKAMTMGKSSLSKRTEMCTKCTCFFIPPYIYELESLYKT